MNFELASDQETIRDAVRGFAERHLRAPAPYADVMVSQDPWLNDLRRLA